MQSRYAAALGVALALDALSPSILLAVDGTVTVKINEAVAFKKNNDDTFGPQQDFYAVSCIDYGAPLFAPEIGDKDHASWNPAQMLSKTVANRNQRFFDLYFELWDRDTCCFGNVDDGFDISPQDGPAGPLAPGGVFIPNTVTGSNPHVTYDVCTGQMSVVGVNGSNPIAIGSNAAAVNGAGTLPGYDGNWGSLRFEVVRDPANWLPDDIAVTKVEIVQAVYHASEAVADKDTALHVVIASSYPFDIAAPVHGTLTDGITTANDARTILIKGGSLSAPGITEVALFDGTGAPPFRPQKSFVAGTGQVSGSATVDYAETISPNAPPQLMDCANLNNTGNATDLPLMHTHDLVTVYAPFDYLEDLNFLTSPQLQGMFTREENLRHSSWPLAALNSSTSASQLNRDHGSRFPFFEPLTTLLVEGGLAAQAGIDRMVLSVRNGWFADNAFRHQFTPAGAIGLSLGTFAPHAVLAEDGWFGTAVHELGHTYGLSQHKCSNQSIPFGPGCFDEYNDPPQDGRPFAAEGFDVVGNVYPSGISVTSGTLAGMTCPAVTPWGRNICAPNIMDVNFPGGYRNWMDTFTFQWLMENTLPHSDPLVANVSGMIELPEGNGDPTLPPPVQGALPFFLYQFMGAQDVDDAPLSPSGEAFSGLGAFRIRLVTPAGVHDFRFDPRFFADPNGPALLGGFSLNVPWDPTTMAVQLIGPSDGRNIECQNMFCAGDGVVLDQRLVTPMTPSVSGLRAGLDTAAPAPPPGVQPGPPTIAPGHDAVVSWDAADGDSPDLRASLIVTPQGAAGGPAGAPIPLEMDIVGGSLRIPHDRFADAPGMYTGRLLVSDGVNTTEMTNPQLFAMCNYTNGGLEACNGIDDDCDGIVDNVVPPAPGDTVELNPQPLPPGGTATVMQWAANPTAQSYDVVYGDAGALLAGGGNFGAAILGCLAEDTTGTSLQVNPGPIQGQAFFFLVRGNNCAGAGSWNEAQPGPQQIDRDPGINSSPAACQP